MIILNKGFRTWDAVHSESADGNILTLSVCNQTPIIIDFTPMDNTVDFSLSDIMLAYNPIMSAVFDPVSGNINVNLFFDDVFTVANPDPKYQHQTTMPVFTTRLAEYQKNACSQASTVASNLIYATYPDYVQQNMQADSNWAMNVIANELNKTINQINAEMFLLIQNISTVPALIAYRNTISSIDMSTYIGTNADKSGLTNAYRTVLYSIVSYQLIKAVRNWCNAKYSAINTCTTVAAVQAVTFTDCPVLS